MGCVGSVSKWDGRVIRVPNQGEQTPPHTPEPVLDVKPKKIEELKMRSKDVTLLRVRSLRHSPITPSQHIFKELVDPDTGVVKRDDWENLPEALEQFLGYPPTHNDLLDLCVRDDLPVGVTYDGQFDVEVEGRPGEVDDEEIVHVLWNFIKCRPALIMLTIQQRKDLYKGFQTLKEASGRITLKRVEDFMETSLLWKDAVREEIRGRFREHADLGSLAVKGFTFAQFMNNMAHLLLNPQQLRSMEGPPQSWLVPTLALHQLMESFESCEPDENGDVSMENWLLHARDLRIYDFWETPPSDDDLRDLFVITDTRARSRFSFTEYQSSVAWWRRERPTFMLLPAPTKAALVKAFRDFSVMLQPSAINLLQDPDSDSLHSIPFHFFLKTSPLFVNTDRAALASYVGVGPSDSISWIDYLRVLADELVQIRPLAVQRKTLPEVADARRADVLAAENAVEVISDWRSSACSGENESTRSLIVTEDVEPMTGMFDPSSTLRASSAFDPPFPQAVPFDSAELDSGVFPGSGALTLQMPEHYNEYESRVSLNESSMGAALLAASLRDEEASLDSVSSAGSKCSGELDDS